MTSLSAYLLMLPFSCNATKKTPRKTKTKKKPEREEKKTLMESCGKKPFKMKLN